MADETGSGTGFGVTADPVWAGAVVWPVPGALVSAVAGLVCAAGVAGLVCAAGAAGPLAPPVGGDVAGADEAALSATAEPLTTAGAPAAASPGVVARAGPAAAGALQSPALLEAVSIVLICGTLMIAIPAASATASSAAIGAQPRLGFSAKLRA